MTTCPARSPMVVAMLCFVPQLALASDDLSGDWEISSMGGDREMRVQQKKTQITIYRELWPEFEGERYKLEHLYRGNIEGGTIKGQLLVKEEGQKEYEILRKFTGRVISGSRLEVDSYLLLRTDSGTTEAKANNGKAAESAKTPAPAAQAKTPPAPTPTPAMADAPPSLFESIMATPGMKDLFELATREIPAEAKRLTEKGDRLFQAGRYRDALKQFAAAMEVPGTGGTDLMHRIGQCHLKLGELDDAKRVLRKALRLDPANAPVRNDYERAKTGG